MGNQLDNNCCYRNSTKRSSSFPPEKKDAFIDLNATQDYYNQEMDQTVTDQSSKKLKGLRAGYGTNRRNSWESSEAETKKKYDLTDTPMGPDPKQKTPRSVTPDAEIIK